MTTVTRIWEVLGGRKVARTAPLSILAFIQLTSRGFPFAALESLARLWDHSLEDAAIMVGIPRRTLYARKADGTLNPAESERVLRFAIITAETEEVLGSHEKAQRWLGKPSRALGGQTPTALMITELGAQLVREELSRIEHGVYA